MTTEQFKQQILPFHAMMYGVAKAILESEDDACDAVQDSMMSLWQKRDSLPSVANLRAYCAASAGAGGSPAGEPRSRPGCGRR